MRTQNSQGRPSDPLISLTRGQLDGIGLAITKVDTHGVFSYGNRAVCDILGIQDIVGMAIADVFKDDDLALVREHLAIRFNTGVSDEYEVSFTRPGDGIRVPIRCSAMPDINERGEIVGAIAIIRDLLAEDILRNINDASQNLRDSFAILETVAMQCQRIVPFDAFGVSLLSVNGKHARQLYIYPTEQFRPSVRWNEMSDYAKALVAENEVVNIPDIEQWLEQPEWRRYRDDPDTQQILDLGFVSSLSFPVVTGKRVVATVGFGRMRAKGPFRKHEEDNLRRLPLGGAVRMALHYQEVGELEFARELMRRIVSCAASSEAIADTLIDEIARHYAWENVSILRPDEPSARMRLLRQKAQQESFLLPEDWQQAIDAGVTGRVYQTAKALNIPDVKAPGVEGLYRAGYADSRSELCLPVTVDGQVFWILNVEDSKRNAFAQEEQQKLEDILREVEIMLQLVSQTRMFAELLRCSKDAVIQTDYRGVILEANPATEDLLGYSEAEMKGKPLASYFTDKGQARRIEKARNVPNDEVHLLHKDGSEVNLLLSATLLPVEFGRKVYVGNDLSKRKRTETLKILRHMYNEIASQIKTPLSLAFSWLGRLKASDLPGRTSELVDKTLKQLEKVDLTFDRLLFYERYKSIFPLERMQFDVPELVEKIRQQLPDAEAGQIDLTVESGVPPVRGNIYQICFCLESLLAYLLRFVAQQGKVGVSISCRGAGVGVLIAGRAPRISGDAVADYAETIWAIRALTELALGREMISRFIVVDHGGTFTEQRVDGERTEYLIVLPGMPAEDLACRQ